MLAKNTIIEEIEFLEQSKMSLTKFYKDLRNALDSHNNQSIWQLSKIITRYQMRK
ncbi:MAG: hypothetical protein ACTSPD_05665 [Promethearchaeota archaeon]